MVSLTEWQNELGVLYTYFVSCAEALENEEIEKTTRFPKLSGDDLHDIVTNAESEGSKRKQSDLKRYLKAKAHDDYKCVRFFQKFATIFVLHAGKNTVTSS